MTSPLAPSLGPLPPGWAAAPARSADSAELFALLRRHELGALGRPSATQAAVEADLSDLGRQTRLHLVLRDERALARAWAAVHDRAAGRVLVSVVVDPDLDPAASDRLADTLFGWAARAAAAIARERGLDVTQLDSGAFDADARQQGWLAHAGFTHTRTWLQMSRPVAAPDSEPEPGAQPSAGVAVRLVRTAPDGMPDHSDVATVHDVLEEAFTDHFNHHVETFDEFTARLGTDPGHRWDHWWIAEAIDDPDGTPRPAGALVGTELVGPDSDPAGSYVDYLGVLASARGRGVARLLLGTVIADAARRRRTRVGLEVDADSPTGAVGLYTSLGFRTSYITQSWHRDLTLDGAPGSAEHG